jgi:predicted regulator of Ras-like GTPase activity (Roadblock/LC7/MglB family)
LRPGKEALMKEEVQAAFSEMLDISTDIDKAVLFSPEEILASNMAAEAQDAAVAQAQELIRLGDLRATEMGSQPLTQLVVEASSGMVFLARETVEGGTAILATGRKSSRVGLVLYDLKTCLRDAREALSPDSTEVQGSEEA